MNQGRNSRASNSSRQRRACRLLAVTVSAAPLLSLFTPAHGQTFVTWTFAGDGTWATAANWDSSNVPDANTEVAVFAGNVGGYTVTLTTIPTPQRIQFNATASSTITINATGTNRITLNPNSAGLDTIFVDPASGDHVINAEIRLGGNDAQGFNIGAGRTLTLNGALSGTANTRDVVKTGSGILVLGGPSPGGNDIDDFTLSQGTLRFSANTPLTGADLIIAGGVLEATGGARTIASTTVSISGNFVFDGADSLTLSAGGGIGSVARTITTNGSGKLTLAGTLTDTSNTGGITKAGTGVLALTATNSTYAGPTTINEGVLEVAALENGGTASSIGDAATSATNLVVNGGTLRFVGASTGARDTNREFTLGVNGGTLDASGATRVEFDSTSTITLTGTNTSRALTLTGTSTDANVLRMSLLDNGTGKSSLLKSGSGKWALTNTAHAYTGNTTINGGTLALLAASNNIITTTPVIHLSSGTAVLDVVGLNSGSFNLAANQTIKGIGTIHAGTTSGAGLNANGNNSVVEVGNSVGSLTVTGNFNLSNTTSTLGISIDLDNSDSSVLVVNGNGTPGTDVTLAGNLRFTFVSQSMGAVPGDRSTYVIILNDGSADAVSGTFQGETGTSGDDEVFNFGVLSYLVDYNYTGTDDNGVIGDGNDVAVTFTSVPEPGSLGVMALAGVTLLRRRR